MGRRVAYFVVGFVVWILLVYTLHYQEVIAGAGVALLTAVLFGRYLPLDPKRLLNPVRWFWLIVYIPVFAYMCLKSNIDVALRVLSPGLQMKPGIVKIKTRLESDIARVLLANSITLTPGTLTLEIRGEYLFVHWINVKDEEVERASELIGGRFEKHLKAICE